MASKRWIISEVILIIGCGLIGYFGASINDASAYTWGSLFGFIIGTLVNTSMEKKRKE